MVELGHSPLGASGAKRWMNCPGSVQLSAGLGDNEDDTFSGPGQAAHALAEQCIIANVDPWTRIGQEMPTDNGTLPVDLEMATAVQEYISMIRREYPDRNQGNSWVERRFHCPSIHEYFYGTSDYVYLWDEERALDVTDYKHGAGIIIEVKDNEQCMYYACGILEDLGLWDKVDRVKLRIVQPRGFHWDGPIREWSISTADLREWLDGVLVPAMDRALVSRDTKSGEHCRFCPARSRQCPQIISDMEELGDMTKDIQAKGGETKELTNAQLTRFLTLFRVAKIINKAAESTTFNRIQAGQTIKGFKLVNAKSNREFKEGAEAAAVAQFKDHAYVARAIKSPAQIDKLPGGKDFSDRWAFKPDKGLTLSEGEDTRPAVNTDTKSMFKPIKEGRK